MIRVLNFFDWYGLEVGFLDLTFKSHYDNKTVLKENRELNRPNHEQLHVVLEHLANRFTLAQ